MSATNTVYLSSEELMERLQERLQDIIHLQQRAHLVEMSKLLSACEKHDVDGAVWEAVMRVGDTVNHAGGFLADAVKLADALMRWIRDDTTDEGEART